MSLGKPLSFTFRMRRVQAWRLSESPTGSLRPSLLSNCKTYVIDCSDPAQLNDQVYPNHYRPLAGVSGISCGGKLANRSLVVYYDAGPNRQCRLWRAAESGGCSWNATAQAFSGPSCVSAPSTRCAWCGPPRPAPAVYL